MLSVFADDSSDETQQRTVAVAGIIASDEEWSRLDRTWLERTGGDLLKTLWIRREASLRLNHAR